ncbi:hypothetical protein AB0F85_09360 [Nocardia fluminea]|uniref:hypothetical protein n=1 Tax=Nocardia fluminea TaxID=134984 RepID=UPI0033DAC47F
MTTPSPDREYTRIDGELPMHFGFKFRPWRYNLSLSELELRSFDRSPEPAFVSIRFFSVFAMKMKTLFNSLTIDLADPSQSLEILRISEVDESKWGRIKCLALKSGDVDSLVACTSYSIRLYANGFPSTSTVARNPGE